MEYLIPYFIGSMSPSIVLSQLYNFDVREQGSGNAGSTNMFRVNKLLGVSTFLLDFFKGFISIFLTLELFPHADIYTVSMLTILGHILPITHNFKGGKGVATAMGTFLYIEPTLLLYMIPVYIQILFFSGISSVSSITMIFGTFLVSLLFENSLVPYTLWLLIVIIVTHIGNLKELVND